MPAEGAHKRLRREADGLVVVDNRYDLSRIHNGSRDGQERKCGTTTGLRAVIVPCESPA
jgi:hypothetical protein